MAISRNGFIAKKTLFVAIFLKKIIVIRKKDKLAATRFFSKWAERHIKMIHCKQSKSMPVREGWGERKRERERGRERERERERQREGLYVANCAKNNHYPCLQV